VWSNRTFMAGRRPFSVALIVALVVSAFIVGTADHVHAAVSQQQIAVPSYIHPGADPGAWNRLIGAPSEKVGIAVANVLNGPDFRRKPIWTDVMARTHGSGKRVLGYVDTGYLGLTGQKTRLGSSDPADWIAQAEQDINVWYALYGESLDGIFFDQGYNTCGPNNDFASWYDHLNQFEKRHHPGALTVLNPGAVVPQCYEDTADILLMYESDYAGYRGQNPIGDLNFHAPDWTPRDPHKIWHIIYDVSPEHIGEVLDLSRQRNAGYVYITDDVMLNPYDTVPGDDYWGAEQAGVTGGFGPVARAAPFGAGPLPAAPGGLSVSGVQYTSARVAWAPVPGASAYYIYLNGHAVANLPASMTAATIGNLAPGGRTYRFHVTAQGPSGGISPPSYAAEATTATLPDGQTVINPRVSREGDWVTYSADFLTPYAFRRVFIAGGKGMFDNCWWTSSRPARCVIWAIENNTLLRYAGDGSGTQWSWTPVASVVPTTNGNTYSWRVRVSDVGGADDDVVVSAEGYAPLTYIMAGRPDTGDGGLVPALILGAVAVAAVVVVTVATGGEDLIVAGDLALEEGALGAAEYGATEAAYEAELAAMEEAQSTEAAAVDASEAAAAARQARLDDLAMDPARGVSDAKSLVEAQVGLNLEESGQLAAPIRRDPTGFAEFIDGNDQLWDIKAFRSDFPNGYEKAAAMSAIRTEIAAGENVILDTSNLSPADLAELHRAVAEVPEWVGKILWWPR
jgi:hypothetical protein